MAVNQLPGQDPAETLGRIKEADGQGFPFAADMRDPEQVSDDGTEVAQRAGGSTLVSNAASTRS